MPAASVEINGRPGPIDPNHGRHAANAGKWLSHGGPVAAMARSFITRSLEPDAADRSYALLRSAGSALSLVEWRDFVRRRTERGPNEGGILALENRCGIIQGLCCYRIDEDLAGDRVCCIDDLLVMDLMDSAAAAAWLIRATEALARRHGARGMRILLPETESLAGRLCRELERRGHRIERTCLGKSLAARD